MTLLRDVGLGVQELRPSKDLAVGAVIALAPACTEMLVDLRDAETWRRVALRMSEHRRWMRIDDYARLYDSEAGQAYCFLAAAIGPRAAQRLSRSLEKAPVEEQQEFLDTWTAAASDPEVDAALDEEFERAEVNADDVRMKFDALPQVKRKRLAERAQFASLAFLLFFHNFLAVMMHGRSMTTLVRAAKAGDDAALLMAAHIDKQLVQSHPWIKGRVERAHACRDGKFLARLGAAQARPLVRSKIQYPGLYVVFALLQSMKWLDSLRHREILEICDRARLDRFQNRIEDLVYLTRRLAEFRRWQETGGLSMH